MTSTESTFATSFQRGALGACAVSVATLMSKALVRGAERSISSPKEAALRTPGGKAVLDARISAGIYRMHRPTAELKEEWE